MNDKLLRKAAKGLSIDQVLIKNSTLKIAEDFIPRYDSYNYDIQFRRHLKKFITGSLHEEIEGNKHFTIFVYDCGIRFTQVEDSRNLNSDSDEDSLVDEEQNTLEVYLQLETQFACHYWMKEKDLSEECLSEFGNHNVPFHVWPYWREQVQSTLAKAGINNVSIPFYAPHLNEKSKEIT